MRSGRGSKLSTIRNGHPAAPGGLQCSRLSVQHGRSASSHRSALRLRGVPALRTPFGRVLAPPAALRPSIAHCASLRVLATPALRASAARKLVCSSPLCPQFAIVALPRYRLQVSRLSVQHGRSASFASSLAALPASLGSSAAIAPSIRNGRPAAPYGLQYSLAHWAYYGLFRALRAAFVRPTGCAASFALIGLPLRLFRAQRARFVRPLWERGAFWIVLYRRKLR